MYLSVTNDYSTIYVTRLHADKSLTYETHKKYPLEIFTDTYDESSPYRTLIGNLPMARIEFDSPTKYNIFKKEYGKGKTQGVTLFNVIDPCYQFIRREFSTPDMTVKPRTWFLDIETDLDNGKFSSPKTANAPITLIQIAESDTKMKYILGWMQDYETDRPDVKYIKCENEKAMLEMFIRMYLNRSVGIMTAWNGDGFDFPYITTRLEKIGISPSILSPFNELEDHTTVIFGQKDTTPKPVGLYWVDTMEVYKKLFPGSRESWGLDFIAQYEKIEGKLNWKEEGFKSFSDFLRGKYSPEEDVVKGRLWELSQMPRTPVIEVEMKKECYKLFVEYGIRDVEVLLEMDRKKKMLDVLMTLAWTMCCNMYDVFGTTKPWFIFLYNDAMKDNKGLPEKPSMEDREYGGGYVYAEPGVYKWVIIEDYASLYPNIMMQKGLSPESYVPEEEIPKDLFELIQSTGIYRHIDCDVIYMNLPVETKLKLRELLLKYDLSMGVNGSCYRRSVDGIIPKKVSQIYKERKFHKKNMLNATAMIEAIKRELESRGEKLDD